MAVDLGNGYARKRDVQSQADLAALAGAAKLPAASTNETSTDPAVVAAVAYLNANLPQNDGAACASNCITAAQMADHVLSNGEVTYPDVNTIKVLTPPTKVNFGLAGAIGGTFVNEQATATANIGSPGKVEPFVLPSQCTTGQIQLKDNANAPSVTNFTPADYTGAGAAKINSVSPVTVTGLAASTLTIYGKNFDSTPTVDFFQDSSGDRIPADTTTSLPATRAADSGGNNVATVQIPEGVYNRPGTWYVRITNSLGYSHSYGQFFVWNPTPPPSGCDVSSTGDFGQLQSPRKLVTQLDDATSVNIAKGLDHQLSPFPSPAYPMPAPVMDSCNGNGGTVPPGAQNDITSVDGNNCVGIKTGMNTNADTNGFVTGGTTSEGTYTGLLAGHTLSGCDRFGLSADATRLGVTTNDDVLSCFLKPGVSVGDIDQATITSASAVNSLTSRIFDSPRFGVVPVINYPVNPQNGYYPIVRFQPVFITDETDPSTNGHSFASSLNGVVLGSSKVVGIKVVAINPQALPETADYDGPTVPYLGYGTKIIRLVD